MKKNVLLFTFIALCLLNLSATIREGQLDLTDWTPYRGMQSAPQIKKITLKWEMDDNDNVGNPIRKAWIAWELGESYIYKGEHHPTANLRPDVAQLTIKFIELRADLCGRAGSTGMTTFFELKNFVSKPESGWSSEVKTVIEWDKLFTDVAADSARKIFADGFKLCNLQITSVEFGNTEKVESRIAGNSNQQAFDAQITEGDNYMAAKNYPAAKQSYEKALQIIPNHAGGLEKLKLANVYIKITEGDALFDAKNYEQARQAYQQAKDMLPKDKATMDLIIDKLKKTEYEIAKTYYDKYLKEGDEAFAKKDYSTARLRYESAGKLFPSDQNVQQFIQQKLANVTYELNKIDYDRLVREGDEAVKRKEFNTAKNKYDQAARIFPADNNVQQFIQQQMDAISMYIAQENYQQQMRSGDQALQNRNYQQAIGFYENALRILPNDAAAIAALNECKRQIQLADSYNKLTKDLKNKYQNLIRETEEEYKKSMSRAAKSFQSKVEECNLEAAAYSECMKTFYAKKMELAADEAGFEVYKDPALKANAEWTSTCTKPNCNQLDSDETLNNAKSEDWLNAAKRKQQFYLQNAQKNEVFLAQANEFTDKAIEKDGKNYAAMTFKANFAEDVIEAMAMLTNVLNLAPNQPDALAMRKNMEANFTKTVGESLAKGNVKFAQKIVDKKLIGELSRSGLNVWETAIDNNQGEVLNILLKEAQGQNVQAWLMRAVDKNSKNCISALLQAGAKADDKDAAGQSPLMLATRKGYQQIVDILSQKSMDKSSALLVAVNENQLETARTLLKNGANTELKDGSGNNLLMVAMERNYETMMQLLLDNGANVNNENFKGETPLVMAASQNKADLVVKLLEKNARPEPALRILANTGGNALELLVVKVVNHGIAKGRTDYVALADQYYTNLAEMKVNGKEAFIFEALASGNLAIGRILLASGTDFNRPVNGKYLVLEAANEGKEDWMREVLNIPGINVNVKNTQRENALHIAAKAGNFELVDMLVQAGCALNDQDEKGNTPILTALTANRKIVAQYLLRNGADLSKFNQRALQPLHLAVANKDINLVGDMLKAGASINSVGENGLTPLHFAAQMGDTNIARLLLNSGADKKLKDNYGRTPAAVAKKFKHKQLAKLLK